MVRGEWKFFTVGGGVWRYNLVGYLDVWIFGWIFWTFLYQLARVGGGIFWMVVGKWRGILCVSGSCSWVWVRWVVVIFWVDRGRWTFFMGKWGWVTIVSYASFN